MRMGVINFSKANCKNCNSCVRACPVKAVRIRDGQAGIMEERCIACGKCLKVCPQNAKVIESELQNVKDLLKNKQRIVVSLAPSFAGAFGMYSDRLCAALKMLGFTYVEETVVGAEVVTSKYKEYACSTDKKCYITSCCPAVNDLIQKHYPDIIQNLIPVVSPMECHGRIIKKRYGDETKVIFIGPCIGKKIEAKEEGTIDAVLTFEELNRWFQEAQIKLDELEAVPFDCTAESMRRYPIHGGVTHIIGRRDTEREILHIYGAEDCIDIMGEIRNGKFQGMLIEMSLCLHGCVDGPAMPENKINVYERILLVKHYANKCEKVNNIVNSEPSLIEVDTHKFFQSTYIPLKQPSVGEIKKILMRIGKYTKQDELNCGVCGYKTCRDKAIAVFNGLAEPTMCLPYMRERAENLSNVIFDLTPSIIVIIDKDLQIIEFNPAAENFFRIKKNRALGLQISMILDLDIIDELKQSQQNILGRKGYLPYQDATVMQSVIWVENHEAILFIIHDITENIRQEERLQNMKINAIEMAQQVIDKQMRVAQEIASLLGETTAETKVSLTKLKRLVQGEEVK
jgi:PAS domain S-box-containing protein